MTMTPDELAQAKLDAITQRRDQVLKALGAIDWSAEGKGPGYWAAEIDRALNSLVNPDTQDDTDDDDNP